MDESSVRTLWDNEARTILAYDFDPVWNWTDFYKAKAHGDGLLEHVAHDVDVVFSSPPNVTLPENFIANVVNVARLRHRNARLAIVVISNGFVRAMFNTLPKLYQREFSKVSFANSLEDARRISQEFTFKRARTGESTLGD
ncbi:MAG: hypothetical protein HXY40_15960 [Chloroflexi bacterium]|nr:hypothetical protein [Chloroflexota bacterium]